MNQRFLPDIFEVKLRKKYHSARLDQIKNRKISKELREQLVKHKYQKDISYTNEEKEIALKNLQLVKRLAEVRYKPA